MSSTRTQQMGIFRTRNTRIINLDTLYAFKMIFKKKTSEVYQYPVIGNFLSYRILIHVVSEDKLFFLLDNC